MSVSPSDTRTTVAVLAGCNPLANTHAPGLLHLLAQGVQVGADALEVDARRRIAVGLVHAEQVLLHLVCLLRVGVISPSIRTASRRFDSYEQKPAARTRSTALCARAGSASSLTMTTTWRRPSRLLNAQVRYPGKSPSWPQAILPHEVRNLTSPSP